MFCAGRLINGLGIGALVTAIPIYQAEVSTPESRGFMVSMHVSNSHNPRDCADEIGCDVCHGVLIAGVDRLRCIVHLVERFTVFLSLALLYCLSDGTCTGSFTWLGMATI